MTMSTTVISRDATVAGKVRPGVRRNLWTYEAYAAATDEDERTELIDGEVRVVPSPLTIHQDIALSVRGDAAHTCASLSLGTGAHRADRRGTRTGADACA